MAKLGLFSMIQQLNMSIYYFDISVLYKFYLMLYTGY